VKFCQIDERSVMNRTKILVEGDSETICEDVLVSLNLLEKWYAYEIDKVENLRDILAMVPDLDFEDKDIWGDPGQSYIYAKVFFQNRRRLRAQVNRILDEVVTANGLSKKKREDPKELVQKQQIGTVNKTSSELKPVHELEQAVVDLLSPVDSASYSIRTVSINTEELSALVHGQKFIARIADWNSSHPLWTFFYCVENADGSQLLIEERRSGKMVGGNVRRLQAKETEYSSTISFRAEDNVRRKILARAVFPVRRSMKVDMSFLGADLESAFNSLRARSDFQL
jgi:muconolactone delta-isomerase